MNDKYVFPALFHKEDDGGYYVTFPDLPECMTEGRDYDESFEMSKEALSLCLVSRMDEGEEIPSPSPASALKKTSASIVVMIPFDVTTYDQPAPSGSLMAL